MASLNFAAPARTNGAALDHLQVMDDRLDDTLAELYALHGDGDAFTMLLLLRTVYGAGDTFAVNPGIMARDGLVPGWTVARYRSARARLIDCGALREVYIGGRGAENPSRFQLAKSWP